MGLIKDFANVILISFCITSILGVGNFFEWQEGADPERVGAGVHPPFEKSETIYGFLAILVRIP